MARAAAKPDLTQLGTTQPSADAPEGALTTAPASPASPEVRDRVQAVINLIRPAVQADGGDIELVDVYADGLVHVRFHGACHGCPSSPMTLRDGIERNLREKVPEVARVVPVP
jgi:Fe-S cluster biogenesis protein NfuA